MPRLTDPLGVGSRTLTNRIIMPPMANNLATEDGLVTDALLDHYRERSRGPALVVVEHTYVTGPGRVNRHQLGVWDDRCVSGLGRLAEAIHEGGALAVLQITHGGARCPAKVTGLQPVAPSEVRVPGDAEDPRALTLDEIARIPPLFAAAAARAAAAGFDGVEVHGAHGYLLNEFVSPYTNRRADAYGGDAAGRLRLTQETLMAVQTALGDEHLLLYRFGVVDDVPGGLTPEDAAALAPCLEGWGVHLLDCSGGLCGSRPAGRTDPGFFIPAAATVKRAVTIPVSGVGGIGDPLFADSLVQNQVVDAVCVGRAQLEDPGWALRALAMVAGAG
jgi:NADPH2 dehydrogenase